MRQSWLMAGTGNAASPVGAEDAVRPTALGVTSVLRPEQHSAGHHTLLCRTRPGATWGIMCTYRQSGQSL